MREEPYIDIIQNLVDTNTKEDLEKKWSKIVDKFDDINQEYIKNTTTPFILLLMDFEKGFTKDLALDVCKARNKEIFKKEGDLKKVFEAYTIQFAILCKENPQNVKNYFGIIS